MAKRKKRRPGSAYMLRMTQTQREVMRSRPFCTDEIKSVSADRASFKCKYAKVLHMANASTVPEGVNFVKYWLHEANGGIYAAFAYHPDLPMPSVDAAKASSQKNLKWLTSLDHAALRRFTEIKL